MSNTFNETTSPSASSSSSSSSSSTSLSPLNKQQQQQQHNETSPKHIQQKLIQQATNKFSNSLTLLNSGKDATSSPLATGKCFTF